MIRMSDPSMTDPAKPQFAPREVDVRYRADGSILLRSPIALDGCRRHICDYLEHWATSAPDRTFLAQRGPDRDWRRLSYADAWRRARAVGQRLLENGLDRDRPVAILTGNSIEHAVMTFGAMTAGIPAAPISPAYSSSSGLARLAEVVDLLRPGMVFVQSATSLTAARALPGLATVPWVSADGGAGTAALSAFEAVDRCDLIDRAFASHDGDSVGKILFTSGSTGSPKGVPNTQRMLCSSIRSASLLFPADAAPVVVDWMPWHHTMGGNSTLHTILRDGGTMYIDDGRPVPGLFQPTIDNLTEIATTLVLNVPAGFQMLVPALEADDALRERFFERLERITFAGASLAADTFARLQRAAVRTTGSPIPILSGYGTTETAPGISVTHWPSEGKGELGLPGPGCEIKLVPAGDRFEIRVRGPNVFAGYLGRPDLTAQVFDDEGYYCVGDAVRFMDPADPSRGLAFAGRLSENFKLSNGTWVLTGDLRSAVIASAPGIADAVVAGHDREDVRLLVWLAPDLIERMRAQHGPEASIDAAVAQVRSAIERYNIENRGATRRIAAFRIVAEPPSMAAGEITDKGYINQRAVLATRRELVEALFTDAPEVTVCRAP